MNYLYDCTKKAFDSNPAKYNKKNNIVKNLKVNFNSTYFESKFLVNFYLSECSQKGIEPKAEILSCYERTLDYWVNERLKRIYNESEVLRIAKELDTLHNESNAWSDIGSLLGDLGSVAKYLPALLLVVGIGYFINAIKK